MRKVSVLNILQANITLFFKSFEFKIRNPLVTILLAVLRVCENIVLT
jgi:hypothetical protein